MTADGKNWQNTMYQLRHTCSLITQNLPIQATAIAANGCNPMGPRYLIR